MKTYLYLYFFLLNQVLFAQTYTWDGGAGTNNWEDALNWSTDLVPGAGIDVVILNDSVVLNLNTGIKSLVLGDNSPGNYDAQMLIKPGVNLNIFNSDGHGIAINSKYATFYNRGRVALDFCDSTAVFVKGTFLNQPNSELSIINCLNGIRLDEYNSEMEVSHNATVTIRKLFDQPGHFYSIYNVGVFKNFGTIHLYDNNFGLSHYGESLLNGTSGLIKLDSSGSLNVNAKMKNNGLIKVNSLTQTGLKQVIPVGDSLINNGTIDIKTTGLAISHAGGALLNASCGRITISGHITMQAGNVINNHGVLNQNSIEPNDFIIGNILNSGIFIDQQNVQSINSHFNNTGSLIKGVKGSLSEGKKELVVHSNANSNYAVSDKWYVDKDKVTLAGNYDVFDDSFTPLAAAINTDTLFFDVFNGVCTKLVHILLNEKYKCFSTISTITFDQAVSSDWHDPFNWDIGIVPDYCYKVVVPSTLTCNLGAHKKARAYGIDCEYGSVLNMEDGVILDIKPK